MAFLHYYSCCCSCFVLPLSPCSESKSSCSQSKKNVVVDGFHWERAIKADETIATGDDQTPYWPKTSISENQNKDYTEYYSVTVQEKNSHGKNIQRRYRMTNLSDWKSLKKGEKVTLMVDRFNFATLT